MVGLCEGGNELPGSLKATIASLTFIVHTQTIKAFHIPDISRIFLDGKFLHYGVVSYLLKANDFNEAYPFPQL
ncbi:hypothetical protein ANN_26310 [Periplaneta americana]|uniref:Per a allergen n=1 Tax=Periplaneta americana TaxID=6978 RepID=A0ABQ8S660_PERAM|nr:hypothetical protein ANN_26310 [Periplaneta americana]